MVLGDGARDRGTLADLNTATRTTARGPAYVRLETEALLRTEHPNDFFDTAAITHPADYQQ